MTILKSMHGAGDNQWLDAGYNQGDLEESIAWARKQKFAYAVIIVWNGLRYQIKHAATKFILQQEGWSIVASIPAYKPGDHKRG